MPRPLSTDRLTLADRLLVEVVCVREEAAGHPAPEAQADAAGREAGGPLSRRLFARALALPDAALVQRAVRQVLQRGGTLIAALLALAGLSGAFTAAAALDAGPPASLPLVLLLLVGSNLFMLLLWLLMMPLGPRFVPGLGRWVMALWLRYGGGADARRDDPRRPVLAVLAGGASGRWLMASLSHAAWLSFSVAAWLALLLLLSVRAYALSWDTTLLSPETVTAWVKSLSFGPALLGASAEQLFAQDAPQRVAEQAGSRWLLAALLVYGVLPRLLAVLVCAALWGRAQARFGRDLQRPGFARLRSRLMPDHQALGVVDAAPAQVGAAASSPLAGEWPRGRVQGLWLDDAADRSPPAVPDIEWRWHGAADSAAARQALLATVAASPSLPTLVLVRATMSPDRGAERFVSALRAATEGQIQLMLVDMDRLTARGATTCRERLADWQALAGRAGLAQAVLQWPGGCT